LQAWEELYDELSRGRPPPKFPPGIPSLRLEKRKTPVEGGGGLRKRWRDEDGNIYEWDSPDTGQSRSSTSEEGIVVSSTLKPVSRSSLASQKEGRALTRWVLLAFEKAGDALISEHALEGARIEDVPR